MDPWRIWCLSCCAFLIACSIGFAEPADNMNISAPAFAPGKSIPDRYAYKGQNISPELRIEKVPVNARSLVLIVDDPDSPSGLWTHWLVWNLSPTTTTIPEGKLPPDAREGKNSFGNVRYDGPAPPSGTHRYRFHLYALNTILSLPSGSDRTAIESEMQEHIVGVAGTFGVYSASH